MSARLLDSNVLIATLLEDHPDHQASRALWDGPERSAIAAHSLAEAYCTLTRPPFRQPPLESWAALEGLRSLCDLLALTAGQQQDAIRRFAAAGQVGPLLYDALIGEVARAHAIPAILTWNTRHMAGLFPDLRVVTPSQYLRRR